MTKKILGTKKRFMQSWKNRGVVVQLVCITCIIVAVILLAGAVINHTQRPIITTISVTGAYSVHAEYMAGGDVRRVCVQGQEGGHISALHTVDSAAPFLLTWEYTGSGIPDSDDGINIMYRWGGDVVSKRYTQNTGNVDTTLGALAENTPRETGNRVIVHDAGQLTLIQNMVK